MMDHGCCWMCGGYGEVTKDDPDTHEFSIVRCTSCEGTGFNRYRFKEPSKVFDSDAALNAAIDAVLPRALPKS